VSLEKIEEKGAALLQSEKSLSGLTFQDVINSPTAEPRWVIDGVIPGGCTLLGGTIKEGKSALVEYIGCRVGANKKVAYFALEYSIPILASRLKNLHMQGLDPTNMHIWHQFDLRDSRMRGIDFFNSRIEHIHPELIVLDTLAAIKSRNSGAYNDEWTAVMEVREIADKIGADLIIVHHTRKASKEKEEDPREAFLGSQGIGAAVDNLVIYDRPNQSTRVRGFGRTISDFETYLTFREGLFTVEDSNNVTLKLIERAAPSEYRVLLVLKDGPQTHSEILSKLQTGKKSDSKMSSDRLYQVLAKLVKKGLVRKPDSRGGNWTYDVSAQILD